MTPPDEQQSEAREHWEGVQNDEASSHNLPDFFPWLESNEKCPKCGSSMGDWICPACGRTKWGAILAILTLGAAFLLAPLLTWSLRNAAARWSCSGCSLLLGLALTMAGIGSVVVVLRTRSEIRRAARQPGSGDPGARAG
jgi:hypothetical protein